MMGYGIIAGSTLVKVPQVRRQTADGGAELGPAPPQGPRGPQGLWGGARALGGKPNANPSKPPAPRQIANVVRARSAEGLSAAAFELESWGLLVHAAYGWANALPFSSYGEAGILLAQNVLLLALLYRFSRAPAARVLAVFALLLGALAAVASGAHRVGGVCGGRGRRAGGGRAAGRCGRATASLRS